MHPIGAIAIGLVTGIVARFVLSGGAGGYLLSAIVGIAGAVGVTFVGQAFGFYREGEPAGFAGTLAGAVVLLVLYHLIVRKRTY